MNMIQPSLVMLSYLSLVALSLGPGGASAACEALPSSACAVNGNDATCLYKGAQTIANPVEANGCDTLTCKDTHSCSKSFISNMENVDCKASQACQQSTISNVGNVYCGGKHGCSEVKISSIKAGGYIDCEQIGEGASPTCFGATISSGNPFTMTCRTTATNPFANQLACGNGGQITNPRGSVFCHGGLKTRNGIITACQTLPITNTVGCVICGKDEACFGVKLVNSAGATTTRIPDHQVYVKNTCTDSQVVDYLNRVHPNNGPIACQDKDQDGVCDVVEKHCANKGNPAGCIKKFKVEWTARSVNAVAAIAPPPPSSSGSENSSNSPESWFVGLAVVVALLVSTVIVILYLGHKNEWVWWKKCCGKKQHEESDSAEQLSSLVKKLNSVNSEDPSSALKEIKAIVKDQEALMNTSAEEDSTSKDDAKAAAEEDSPEEKEMVENV